MFLNDFFKNCNSEIFDVHSIDNAVVRTTSKYYMYNPYKSRMSKSGGIIDSVQNLINLIDQKDLVSNLESELLNEFLYEVNHADSTKNYSNFKNYLASLKLKINNSNFDYSKGDGVLINYVVYLTEYSVNYWSEKSIQAGKRALPLWVGADAVGAVAGGGSSMWSQRNNKNFDWWEIGGQAVIWGASSSLLGSRGFNSFF